MNKSLIDYIVDVLMGLSFLVTAMTGVIIFFFLPGGVPRSGYQTFLGIIKQDWTSAHNWSGLIMIFLVLVHLVLHWRWILCMTKSLFASKKSRSCK